MTEKMQTNSVDKAGYPHFMLKEIMEQPEVVQRTLTRAIASLDKCEFQGEFAELDLAKYQRILVIACGTAYHAGLVGKHFMEKIARVPVEVELAAELRYSDPLVDSETLVLVISQSGETGDTLAAMHKAKDKGGTILAITNVPGSTIAREAHHVVNTVAGAEVSIASTKAYMAQILTLYLVGLELAIAKKRITLDEGAVYLKALTQMPQLLEDLLSGQERYKAIAEKLARNEHAFFLGRGLDAAVAMEGSLKLKETTYIHAEPYSAGEFRHGPIALIEEGMPTIVLATQPELLKPNTAIVEELKSRGAWIIGVTMAECDIIASACDTSIILPKTLPEFAPMLTVVPLQLIAYYTACTKGLEVDNPRYLVKSVKDAN